MDDKTIFDKTLVGEEAVRERTRLVQRNLRLVLIIVDGLADVAELKRKGGDAALVESALTELEGMGLIVARSAAAAVEPPAEAPVESVPSAAADERPVPAPVEGEGVAPPPIAAVLPPAVEAKPPACSWVSSLAERWRARRQMRAAALAAKERPDRRGWRRGHSWSMVTTAKALASLLAALLLAVLLFPYGIFREDIEKQATAALGDVVKVEGVALAFAPWPHLALRQVSVGAEPYARAEVVRLSPEPGSLFAERRFMREVRIEGLRLSSAGVTAAARWFAPATRGRVGLRRVTIADMSLGLWALPVDKWSGELLFGDGGEWRSAELRNAEDSVHVQAAPTAEGFALKASCSAWKAPFGGGLVFDSLELAGMLTSHGLRLDSLGAVVFGGRLRGRGSMEWNPKSLLLTAELGFRHAEMRSLLEAFGQPGLVNGPADAEMRLSSSATDPAALLARATGEGRFEVAGGSLRRLGLVEALRGNGRGSTRFERLAGSLTVGPAGLRLEKLQLSSGALRADGWLGAAADGRLDGRFNVAVLAAGGARVSLAVTGTADDPWLKK